MYRVDRSVRLQVSCSCFFFFFFFFFFFIRFADCCVRSTRESVEIYSSRQLHTVLTSIQRELSERATFRMFAGSLHDTGLCTCVEPSTRMHLWATVGNTSVNTVASSVDLCKLQNRTMCPGSWQNLPWKNDSIADLLESSNEPGFRPPLRNGQSYVVWLTWVVTIRKAKQITKT